MIEFCPVLPEAIDYLPPQAVKYLDNAAKHPPASEFDASQTIAMAKAGLIDIYLAIDGKLTGAFALRIGDELDILLLGGDNFMGWKDDFWNLCILIMAQRNCKKTTFHGRKGFEKLFPALKPVGTIYEYLA